MSFLVISLPLLPLVVLATIHLRVELMALSRRVIARVRRILCRKVCVDNTHAFIFSNCIHGRAHSVVATFDLYANANPSLSIGPEKGEFLDDVVRLAAPVRALELGMHCGYSSVRILRQLPASSKLLAVEMDAHVADKGEEIILVAGFKHTQFQVLTCSSAEAIASLRAHLGESVLDLVVMDHDPEQYLPDLLGLRRGGLLSPHCTLLLNGDRERGTRALLEHVTARPCCYTMGRQLHGMVELHCDTAPHTEGSACVG